MRTVSEEMYNILSETVGKKPKYILESCNLYHFYFIENDNRTSFSYSKESIIKILFKIKDSK